MQTRKFFFIKVFVWNESILNFRTLNFEEMGYNFKRDGCSIATQRRRIKQWRKPNHIALERYSQKVPQILFHHFYRPHGQWWHYHSLAIWHWFVLHLFVFCFLHCNSLILIAFPSNFVFSPTCILMFWEVLSLHVALFKGTLWRSSHTLTLSRPSSSIYKKQSMNTFICKFPHNTSAFLFLYPKKWKKCNIDLLCT